MKQQLLLFTFFWLIVAQANAQTIPKSIDKPVPPKQQQQKKDVVNSAVVARDQVMSKRTGHYIFKKKDYLDQKVVFTDGYVDVSYRGGRLYIKGSIELQYTYSTYQSESRTMLVTKHKYEGPFEWSGKFNRRTEYQGGETGYMFWNGEDGYLTTEVKKENGENVKFYFVEVYDKSVWISTGTESFNFYR
jgi:hypothetical protein